MCHLLQVRSRWPLTDIGEVILDIFAGPGGWEEGLAMRGRTDVVGVDSDFAACSTATWAGHARFHDDVTELAPGMCAGIEGLLASPPCQALSMAGPRKGVADLDLVIGAIRSTAEGQTLDQMMRHVTDNAIDPRSALALQPLRYAMAALPEWMAWEQVPLALPIWSACAHVLRRVGYHVWTGLISAEQYGAPQTRTRAILTAHRTRRAIEPPPTHSRFFPRHPDRSDRDVLPWVSMAQVLDRPDAVYIANSREGATTRRLDQPAPVMAFGRSQGRWREADGSFTTITLAEASILQTFPADYPWHGTKESRYQQIANAIPPLMASHILASLGV